jgi:hypothetical protein
MKLAKIRHKNGEYILFVPKYDEAKILFIEQFEISPLTIKHFCNSKTFYYYEVKFEKLPYTTQIKWIRHFEYHINRHLPVLKKEKIKIIPQPIL